MLQEKVPCGAPAPLWSKDGLFQAARANMSLREAKDCLVAVTLTEAAKPGQELAQEVFCGVPVIASIAAVIQFVRERRCVERVPISVLCCSLDVDRCPRRSWMHKCWHML